jgi:hypothetical protein
MDETKEEASQSRAGKWTQDWHEGINSTQNPAFLPRGKKACAMRRPKSRAGLIA